MDTSELVLWVISFLLLGLIFSLWMALVWTHKRAHKSMVEGTIRLVKITKLVIDNNRASAASANNEADRLTCLVSVALLEHTIEMGHPGDLGKIPDNVRSMLIANTMRQVDEGPVVH